MNKPLPLSEVEAKCPEGKVCSNRTSCTLADVFDHCSLYKDAMRKASGEPDPYENVPDFKIR